MARAANKETCKRLYLDAVERCPQSTVKMLSCSLGEVSYDTGSGGRYNSSLFDCVADWVEGERSRPSYTTGVLSIAAVHDCAAEATKKKSGGQQNPDIEKPKTGPYFPFAVFA